MSMMKLYINDGDISSYYKYLLDKIKQHKINTVYDEYTEKCPLQIFIHHTNSGAVYYYENVIVNYNMSINYFDDRFKLRQEFISFNRDKKIDTLLCQ